MMYGGNGWGWGVMMFMPLFWIILVGLIVWAVVQFAQPERHRTGTDSGAVHRETPLKILERRYASGEIDTETFLETRDHLAGPGSRPS